MEDANKKAYFRFLDYLETRRKDSEVLDIRDKVLSLRNDHIGVGYVKETIDTKYGANLRNLFKNVQPIGAKGWDNLSTYIALGAIYSNPEQSHKGASKVFQLEGAGQNIILMEQGFLASSHSWLHSFKEGKPEYACLGYVYDDISYYYMTDYPNRLIKKLNSSHSLGDQELSRARNCIEWLVDKNISKYNAQPFEVPTMTEGYKRRVLVCDQSYADASTIYGKVKDSDFEAMLLAAIKENPDAEIIIKSHPDTYWEDGKRAGFYSHLKDYGRVRIIRKPVNPFSLFEYVDTVYVGTSQLGLEALFAGKKVVCFGAPFYAGWGLTDDRQVIPHRYRTRTLDEIFYYFYIWYTIYHVPGKPCPSAIEDAIEYIELKRPVGYVPKIDYEINEPKVSVILPVYNVENYIREAISSIQCQTLKEIEIIPVNDCSPDGSQEIIDEMAAADPRIRPIKLDENVGQGFARNHGIEAASGEYLFFLDPDDYFNNKQFLESAYEMAVENAADMVRGQKLLEVIEDEKGEIVAHRKDKTEDIFKNTVKRTTFVESPELLHSRHFWLWGYKREFIESNSIRFINTQWEERPFLLKALLLAKQVSLLKGDAFIYRVRPNSTARRSRNLRDYDLQINNMIQVIGLFKEHGAFTTGSSLQFHAAFTITQYIHYMYFGLCMQFARSNTEGVTVRDHVLKLSNIWKELPLKPSELLFEHGGLSTSHVKANAYPLIYAATRSNHLDIVLKALQLEPITQGELYECFLSDAESDIEKEFVGALNTYARNAKFVTITPNLARSKLPDKPRLVIHIGSTKTGSTYLQHLMEENRPELIKNCVWYPEVGLFWQENRPHKQAGHANFTASAVKKKKFLLKYINNGLKLLSGRIHTIILSSEAFFLHDQAERLVDYFADFDVEMIVYLRRQDEWANSQYVELVGGGAVNRVGSSFDDWVASESTKERLDYLSMLERWHKKLPLNKITVRAFEMAQFLEGDLVRDFAATAGLPELLALTPPHQGKKNSFPLENGHLKILRRYNSEEFGSREKYLGFIEAVTNGIRESRERTGRKIHKPWVISEEQGECLLADYAKCNETIARKYMGREDGALFLDTKPKNVESYDGDLIPINEFELIADAFEHFRYHEKDSTKPSVRRHDPKSKVVGSAEIPGQIVNYGLFGWRLYVFKPILRIFVKKKASKSLQRVFEKDPYTFFCGLDEPQYRKYQKIFFPKMDPYGIWGVRRKITVPMVSPFVKKIGGISDLESYQSEPIKFFRDLKPLKYKVIGRILFPAGELIRQ